MLLLRLAQCCAADFSAHRSSRGLALSVDGPPSSPLVIDAHDIQHDGPNSEAQNPPSTPWHSLQRGAQSTHLRCCRLTPWAYVSSLSRNSAQWSNPCGGGQLSSCQEGGVFRRTGSMGKGTGRGRGVGFARTHGLRLQSPRGWSVYSPSGNRLWH